MFHQINTGKGLDIKKYELTQKIVYTVAEKLEIGMSEWDAKVLLEEEIARFGITQVWHPNVIKFDSATLIPLSAYKAKKDRFLTEIAIIDVGLVIDGEETDFGLTRVMTDNAALRQLSSYAEELLEQSIAQFGQIHPSELYEWISQQAQQKGYRLIAPLAGHKVGVFPTKKSDVKIRKEESCVDFSGDWMIEIHIANDSYGAFFEKPAYF